jgi:hypothetical protein
MSSPFARKGSPRRRARPPRAAAARRRWRRCWRRCWRWPWRCSWRWSRGTVRAPLAPRGFRVFGAIGSGARAGKLSQHSSCSDGRTTCMYTKAIAGPRRRRRRRRRRVAAVVRTACARFGADGRKLIISSCYASSNTNGRPRNLESRAPNGAVRGPANRGYDHHLTSSNGRSSVRGAVLQASAERVTLPPSACSGGRCCRRPPHRVSTYVRRPYSTRHTRTDGRLLAKCCSPQSQAPRLQPPGDIGSGLQSC